MDAFDQGSYIKIIPEENKIIGYTTRNSGGVPDNFRNYFVIVFDKPFTFYKVWENYHTIDSYLEWQANHVGAAIGFATQKGEQVHARVASSFISPGQAELNLQEIGRKSFDNVKETSRKTWNDILGRSRIEADNTDHRRPF